MTSQRSVREARASGTAARALAGGARAMAPWLLGIVPFGLVIGVRAANANVPVFAGWLTGPLVYAGSAQAAVIELLGERAAPLLIVIAAVAINSRLLLYSATMARAWRDTPLWWRALGAYLLVDPSFAVAVDGYERIADRRIAHLHYLGAGLTLWVSWVGAIAVGATAGAHLPASFQLDMIIPLFLAGEVAHRVRERTHLCAAITAGVVAALASPLPVGIAPVAAIFAGASAGLWSEHAAGRQT